MSKQLQPVNGGAWHSGCGGLFVALGLLFAACAPEGDAGEGVRGAGPSGALAGEPSVVGAMDGAGEGAAGDGAVAAAGSGAQAGPDEGVAAAAPEVGTGGGAGADAVMLGSGGTGADTDPGDGAPVEAARLVECSPIGDGMATVTVDGTTRTFQVQRPADTSEVALLFVWHGWLQQPGEFANTVVYDVPAGRWVPFDPNAFPMPLMIVTPHDLKLIPPVGLDWDIASGEMDFPFFEGMLDCIQEQYSVDESRIYSFGFSAGAVFTNLLSAKYPELFAATISESGAWFNDETQWSDVTIPLVQWQWPAFDAAHGGNVLLTHGGPEDFATVISLESTNRKAVPFLREHGRTVVDCAHSFGHTLDPDLTQAMYYDYLWAHRRGGPPLSALPAGFPTPAQPVGATSCTFHPAP